MSDEFITVRLRRDHAQFLEANLALMADRTRAAMRSGDLAEERRAGLFQRAILLEHLDDALRVALLICSKPLRSTVPQYHVPELAL